MITERARLSLVFIWLICALNRLCCALFARGQNIARLQASKAQQQQALNNFEYTIMSAAAEVSEALTVYEKSEPSVGGDVESGIECRSCAGSGVECRCKVLFGGFHIKSKAYTQAVRSQIISAVATTYYSIVAVRQQLELSRGTAVLWPA